MSLVEHLQQDYPKFSFVPDQVDAWSADRQEIRYRKPLSKYAILHELGHALCNHTGYRLDVELLKLEVDAWEKAKQIAPHYQLNISAQYINRCLNTYRDWLLARSRCPDCNLVGLQSTADLRYRCCNCFLSWSVSQTACLTQPCFVRRIRQK